MKKTAFAQLKRQIKIETLEQVLEWMAKAPGPEHNSFYHTQAKIMREIKKEKRLNEIPGHISTQGIKSK